jgi:hypothetical protein
MRTNVVVCCILVALLLVVPVVRGEQSGRPASAWRCSTPPVEACFTQRGRLSSQNGVARMMWLIGTIRIVRVENDEDEIPGIVEKYLVMTSPNHSYIYGEFEICPLAPDEPGHMRPACISGGRKLVVQNLRRSRPAFRLLSTWPRDAR